MLVDLANSVVQPEPWAHFFQQLLVWGMLCASCGVAVAIAFPGKKKDTK